MSTNAPAPVREFTRVELEGLLRDATDGPWVVGPVDDTVVTHMGADGLRYEQSYRWLRYKPKSEQARRGIKGRWQRATEYGGWENCPAPVGDWKPSRALSEENASG